MAGTKRFALEPARLKTAGGREKATRLFVRAVAIMNPKSFSCDAVAAGQGKCTRRYALSNPIWIRHITLPPPPPGGGGVVD